MRVGKNALNNDKSSRNLKSFYYMVCIRDNPHAFRPPGLDKGTLSWLLDEKMITDAP